MSSQPSIDAAIVEKSQARKANFVFFQQIAQLARSGVEPEQFYPEILRKTVAALGANGSAVWVLDAQRRLQLYHQINISPNLIDRQSEDYQPHARFIQDVMTTEQPRLVAPRSGAGEPDPWGNPTDSLLIAAPVKSNGVPEGVLEIFQRADSQPDSHQGQLRFLVQISQHVGDWLKVRKLRTLAQRQSFWAKVNQFSKSVHDSLDVRETAYLIANDGRRLIECDRVTVTTTRAGKQVVQAISGQDTIDTRANIVTLLQGLSSKACATGDALWYSGKSTDFPPQIASALEDYVDQSHTKSLAIIPLRKVDQSTQNSRDEVDTEEDTKYQSRNGTVIGALIVEQIDAVQSRDLIVPRLEEVCQQSARALGNAIEHNSLFLMPVWRTIGKSRVLTTSKNLPKTLLISGLILIAVLSLFLIIQDFELKAEGTLEPVMKRRVFANEKGFVTGVKIQHGQFVNARDDLIVMQNMELEQLIAEKDNELQSKIEELANARHPLQNAQTRNRSVAMLEAERDGLRNQLEILLQRWRQLTIKSPINGQIVTWRAKVNLLHRPVARGQEVLRIANLDGDWRLEVFLPDKKIGHLNRMLADNEGEPIEVTYILKSNPDVQLDGTLELINESAEAHEQHGHSFRLFITLDRQTLVDSLKRKNKGETKIKQGTEVMVKLKCGRAPVGYCWFHELFEWVEMMLFSI